VSLETAHGFGPTWFLGRPCGHARALGSELAVWLLEPGATAAAAAAQRRSLGAARPAWFRGWQPALGIESLFTSPSFALAQQYSGPSRRAVSAISSILTSYRLERPLPPMSCSPKEEEEAPVAWCPAGGGMAPKRLKPAARRWPGRWTVSMEAKAAMAPDHAGGFSGLARCCPCRELLQKGSTSAALGWARSRRTPAQTGPAALPKPHGLPHRHRMAVVFSAAVSRLGSRQRRCSRPGQEGVQPAPVVSTTSSLKGRHRARPWAGPATRAKAVGAVGDDHQQGLLG